MTGSQPEEPRILLLHGYFAGKAAWDRVRYELRNDPVTTLAPDLLGYGDHKHVRVDGQYSLERIVEHVAPFVERERPTHLVGHSMGAMVALALDALYPGQFQGIGAVGLPVFTDSRDGKRYQEQRGRRYVIYMRTHAFSHYGCGIVHGLRHTWMPFAHHFAPRQPNSIFESVFNHSRAAHNRGLTHIAFGGLAPVLAEKVTAPVYMLQGLSDRTVPIDRARELAARKGWHFETTPRANHQVIVERPVVVADWVRRRLLPPRE